MDNYINAATKRGLLIATLAILVDQASKIFMVNWLSTKNFAEVTILPIFSFTLVHNKGISFGLLGSDGLGRWLLVAFTLAVVAYLFNWLRRSDKPILITGLGLVIGGAIGNVIDRIRLGYVIDFLNFSGMKFPWVFNVADSAIFVGVVLLLWFYWKHDKPVS